MPSDFAERFLAAAPDPGVFATMAPAELDEALRALVAAARAAWPEVTLSGEAFVPHLAAAAAGAAAAGGPVERLAAIRPDDLYLARACAAGDARAVAAFEARVLGPARMALGRFEQQGTLVEDAIQAVREKLLVGSEARGPRIEAYDGRGSLEGWIKVILVRTALNLARGRRHESLDDVEGDDVAIAARANPELDAMRAEHLEAFREAVARVIGDLAVDQRSLLRFYYLERLDITAIGHLFGVHRATVARRINQLREELAGRVRAEIASKLRLSGSELKSFLRVIESQLDVSVLKALRRDG